MQIGAYNPMLCLIGPRRHTDADSQYSDAISGLLADLVKSDDATVAAHAAKMAAI